MLTLECLRRALRASTNSQNSLCKLLKAKCVHVRGFQHVLFVGSIWLLGAHGVPKMLGGASGAPEVSMGEPGRVQR